MTTPNKAELIASLADNEHQIKGAEMPRPYQFSVRSLLVLIMLVASYCAGWVSHRSWQRRNIEQAIDDALQQVNGPVQVEKVAATDVIILRGREADVEAMQEGINKIESAAKK